VAPSQGVILGPEEWQSRPVFFMNAGCTESGLSVCFAFFVCVFVSNMSHIDIHSRPALGMLGIVESEKNCNCEKKPAFVAGFCFFGRVSNKFGRP